MSRFFPTVILCAAAMLLAGAGAAAQSYSDLVPGRPGTVTFTLDGRNHTAAARAYMVGGRLFINGIWVEDSTVKFGRAGLASTLMLRVKGLPGEYTVGSGAATDALFTLHYGGDVPSRVYAILRADPAGGSGRISVASVAGDRARGTFEVTAYDRNDPSMVRNISGSFDVEFRRLGAVRED